MPKALTLTHLPITGQSTVTFKLEVTAQVNISAFVARQKASRYLILQAGDQLSARDPELVMGPNLMWRVPVQYTPSRRGSQGIVGHLLVDAVTGEVTVADERSVEELMRGAEVLEERLSPPP